MNKLSDTKLCLSLQAPLQQAIHDAFPGVRNMQSRPYQKHIMRSTQRIAEARVDNGHSGKYGQYQMAIGVIGDVGYAGKAFVEETSFHLRLHKDAIHRPRAPVVL